MTNIRNRERGFNLIELIVVIAIIGIISIIIIPIFSDLIEQSRLSVDKATLKILNKVTTTYKIENNKFGSDIFSSITEDEARMLVLVDNSYISNIVIPKQKNASFQWNIDTQIWLLYVDSELVKLSPFGNDFSEISNEMINLITANYTKQILMVELGVTTGILI